MCNSYINELYIPIFYDLERKEKIMKFDKEYSTSFIDEMQFLREKGIRYTWVYINEEKVSVWKYKKEKRLWDALSELYSNKKYEL